MKFYFWILFCIGLVSSLWAQSLKVRLMPDAIYAGDAFRLEVSLANSEVVSVTPHFSIPTQIIGQSKQFTSINGQVSSSLTLQVLPQTIGVCRLESLSAVTKEGKTVTYSQPLEVQVKELLPDPDVTVDVVMTPTDPLPGDEVILRIKVCAPALNDKGTLRSPFLESTFFGGVQERLPQVTFNATTGEDSPLRQLTAPQLQSKTTNNKTMEWIIAISYRAVRVGEQIFPAPVIRDTRYSLDEKTNQLTEARCLTIGKPLTVTVQAPPEEGRPDGFTGAVAETFKANVTLDALNVKVGDPVRLTITFLTDAASEQIRAPQLPLISGFRIYGEPIRDTFEGGCSFAYTLRPIQQGLLEIPSMPFAWFEKHARAYQVEQTIAVPLYAHPSSQLVLLGDDGEAFASILPPALRLDEGAPLLRQPSTSSLIVFGIGMLAFLVRLLWHPMRRGAYWICTPIRQSRPTFRACSALKRVTTPVEALAIIREWSGRPALTANELASLLPETPEAQAVIAAVMQLEQCVYTQGGSIQNECQTLMQTLPKVPRPRSVKQHSKMLLLLFACAILPNGLTAITPSFTQEQATFVSLSASTPQDYARAANLWMMVERQGEMPQTARLNAASCALFARYPMIAEQLIQGYEIDYGRDQDSERVIRAAAEQLEKPVFWGRMLFAFHYMFSYAERLSALCWGLGCFLLLCAVPWKSLNLFRILLAFTSIVIMVSVLVSSVQRTRLNVLETLPVDSEQEVKP